MKNLEDKLKENFSATIEKVDRMELSNGDIEYRNKKGELHCETGPAIVYGGADGVAWYLEGKEVTKKDVLDLQEKNKLQEKGAKLFIKLTPGK